MSKSDLPKKAETAPNTMTKLRRHEEVSLTILSKICKTLHVDFGDIVEYVPDAEIWDLYNENRELLGKDHVRGGQLPIDGYHLVVHVWIRNSKGEYLISQRSANRPTNELVIRLFSKIPFLQYKFKATSDDISLEKMVKDALDDDLVKYDEAIKENRIEEIYSHMS